MMLFVAVFLAGLLSSVSGECDDTAFMNCVEAAEASFLFDINFMDDLSKEDCTSKNINKTTLQSLLSKISDGDNNCIDTHLSSASCKVDTHHIDKLHTQMKLRVNHALHRLDEECELGLGNLCMGEVMSCIVDNIEVTAYLSVDEDKVIDNSTQKERPEDVFQLLLTADVRDETQYEAFCKRRSEDSKSDFKKALQCIGNIKEPCKVDLSGFLSKAEDLHTMLALTFQMQYWACTDGCDDLPERLDEVAECAVADIMSLTPSSVTGLNDTYKAALCSTIDTYASCIEDESKGCAFTLRETSQLLTDTDTDRVNAMKQFQTSDNCPDSKSYTELVDAIKLLDEQASDLTISAGAVMQWSVFVMVLSTVTALIQ